MFQFSAFSFILSSSLFLLILIYKVIFNRRATKGSNLKLPPGPKKLPVIGNLHQMIGELPHHRLYKLGKMYGPVFYLQVGELPFVIITTPEATKEVLKTQELAFLDHPPYPPNQTTSYENSSIFFTPYGEFWRQLRKICMLELLGVKSVRSFKSIREDEVSNVIKYIESLSGLPFNLSERISACMNRVVSKAFFGDACKQQDEFIALLHEVSSLASRLDIAEVFPSLKFLRYLSWVKLKLNRVYRKYDKILSTILADYKMRRENLGGQAGMPDKKDLADGLLRLQESNDSGFHLTTDNIKGVIFEIISAGTDTSSATLEWVMSELLMNPRVMAKAQNEIRRVLKGKDRVQESDIEELNYLKCIIKETLRMHPPIPLIPRAPSEECKVNGYDIPMNSRVLIHVYALGRDPRYWTNPEKFEPERFIESSEDYKGLHYQLVPFGSGRRMCPGMAFGTASIELLLASLLYHFDWKLANGQTPEQLDMTEAFGLSVSRKYDLYVIASPCTSGSA
ncbi:hypothetical protein EUGRSUZ_D01193 [Eucalyptus grandis]|uniref:Uncharacterized protein n=2 Tax=Eucalyptus grandis TaxID=71139 RepID=A0ACC3L5I4_EUCGR|nr:hypothetical protein EUGRSUZ_D01193 [Eucalyptus grandis]